MRCIRKVDYYEFLMYGLIYIKDAFFLFLDFQSDLVIFLSYNKIHNLPLVSQTIYFFKKKLFFPHALTKYSRKHKVKL